MTECIYTHYFNSAYSIYQAKSTRFLNQEVDPSDVDITPGTLPGTSTAGRDIVHQQLYNADDYSYEGMPMKTKDIVQNLNWIMLVEELVLVSATIPLVIILVFKVGLI